MATVDGSPLIALLVALDASQDIPDHDMPDTRGSVHYWRREALAWLDEIIDPDAGDLAADDVTAALITADALAAVTLIARRHIGG